MGFSLRRRISATINRMGALSLEMLACFFLVRLAGGKWAITARRTARESGT